MTEEEARQIGFPIQWLPTDLTPDEARLNRCDECSQVIKEYKTARWRLTMTPIRCDHCAKIKMMTQHYGEWEARYAP